MYLTAKDIAEELRIPLRTAYQYMREMARPLTREALNTWISDHERPPDVLPRFRGSVAAGGVYFVQGGEQGAIKIGLSRHIDKRVQDLSKCSPVELRVVGVVYLCVELAALEARFHARLAAHRLHGEWFANHPEVRIVLVRALEGALP